MAFNPLRSFRRNQKTMLAGLTIMCMFIFVLQFSAGGGDFFDQVTNWIGYSGRSQHAGNLYGKVVTGQDVDLLQMQRQLANEYMMRVNALARGRLQEEQIKGMTTLMPNVPQLSMLFQNPSMRDPAVRIMHLQRMLLPELMAQKKEKEAQQMQQLIQTEMKLMRLPQVMPGMPYFGGAPGSLDDLFMFKVWLRQADELGIQLSREELRSLILLEAQGAVSYEGKNNDLQLIRESILRGGAQYANETYLARGLMDEFRVRLARSALLGYNLHPYVVSPGVTPHEMWEFFQKQRTANQVSVLPIAVDQAEFLAKVGEPTDDELKKLFEKYKDKELDASTAEPGFKQPARIEVAWIHADPESPYYKSEARTTALAYGAGLLLGQHMLAGGLAPEGGAVSAAVVAANLAPPLKQDLIALSKYSWMTEIHRGWYRQPTFFGDSLNPRDKDQRLGLAALVGQAAGSSATLGGSILAAPLAYEGTTLTRKNEDGAKIYATLFLSGAAGMPVAAFAQAKAITPEKEFKPFEQLRDEALVKAAEDIAKDLADYNMAVVEDGVRYYGGHRTAEQLREKLAITKPEVAASLIGQTLGDAMTWGPGFQAYAATRAIERDKSLRENAGLAAKLLFGSTALSRAAVLHEREQLGPQLVKEFLAQAVKRYHLELGGTERPRDKFSVAGDPGLEKLRAQHQGDDNNFAEQFFGQFFQQYLPRPMQNRYAYWKSADWPAYVPAFEDVKGAVAKRWKFEKARALAKAEAEEIAARARKEKSQAARVLNDGSPRAGKVFDLYDIAPITKRINLGQTQRRPGSFQPYNVPTDRIKYPSKEMREKLLAMREAGEVAVVSDGPEGNYYVLALTSRDQPSAKSFFDDYARSGTELIEVLEGENQVRRNYILALHKRLEEEAGMSLDPEFKKNFEKSNRREDGR